MAGTHEGVFIRKFDRIEGLVLVGPWPWSCSVFVVQLMVGLNEATSKQASSTAAAIASSTR